LRLEDAIPAHTAYVTGSLAYDGAAAAAQSGDPGATVSHTVTLTNSGNAADTFRFSASSSNGWLTTAPVSVSVPAGEATTAVINVTAPGAAPAGATDEATVTAVSALAPAVEERIRLQTTVNQVAGLSLGESPAQDGEMGTAVVYTHTLRNEGNGEDTFLLTAVSDQGWTVTVGADPTLAAGEAAIIRVTVHAPEEIAVGTVDTTTLTARSAFDETVTAAAQGVTTAVRADYPLFLPVVRGR
jgi:uncharacterized membrane protein